MNSEETVIIAPIIVIATADHTGIDFLMYPIKPAINDIAPYINVSIIAANDTMIKLSPPFVRMNMYLLQSVGLTPCQ